MCPEKLITPKGFFAIYTMLFIANLAPIFFFSLQT